VEHAVETKQARLLVQLVLVLAALRNFDDDRKRAVDEGVVDVASCHGCIATMSG
jgi:hypothetical protein